MRKILIPIRKKHIDFSENAIIMETASLARQNNKNHPTRKGTKTYENILPSGVYTAHYR